MAGVAPVTLAGWKSTEGRYSWAVTRRLRLDATVSNALPTHEKVLTGKLRGYRPFAQSTTGSTHSGSGR